MSGGYFTPELFRFLDDLKRHNERPWFAANKRRYETAVRDPALRFVSDIGPRLAKISPQLVADARPVGGSFMRIHRDIRFSKDKSPYKTAISFYFRHHAGRDGAAPGLYLHLEPGQSFAGGGVWQPEPAAVQKIREAIAAEAKSWTRIINAPKFRDSVTFHGEPLKRPPAGFDPAHPCIEDIKRKDFAAGVKLTDAEVTGGNVMDAVLDRYRIMVPMLRFLAEALEVPF
jgi:uncharacterized protein (TIGR02453 family)